MLANTEVASTHVKPAERTATHGIEVDVESWAEYLFSGLRTSQGEYWRPLGQSEHCHRLAVEQTL